jgi:hypothetical protein
MLFVALLHRWRCNTRSQDWPHPTIAGYNASVVNFYNATGSLALFENKNILYYLEKRSSLLQRWRCSCKLKIRRTGSRIDPWDVKWGAAAAPHCRVHFRFFWQWAGATNCFFPSRNKSEMHRLKIPPCAMSGFDPTTHNPQANAYPCQPGTDVMIFKYFRQKI